MACTLTTGRKIPCKSAFGGIKKVLFADYGTIASIAVDSTTKEATITDGSPAPSWFEYDVKGNSSLETTVTSSRENGTTFYTQTLNLTLTYLDAKTQAELQTLAVSRPYIVVVDYYGNNFLCGFENGMECTGGYSSYRCSSRRFKWVYFNIRGNGRNCTLFLRCSSNGRCNTN